MNIMILPSDSLTLFNTALSLSSNSPLNLAPATRAPISSSKIDLSFNVVGTSFATIRLAKPSMIAVLPTPGSPINTGLFFVFLERILMILRISSSRPITGSIFPSLASATMSLPYFSSTFSFSFCSLLYCIYHHTFLTLSPKSTLL